MTTTHRTNVGEVGVGVEAETYTRDEHLDDRHGLGEIGTLISELSRESTLLVRQEAALVRAEMDQKVHQMQKGATELSAGAGLAYLGLGFLCLSLMFLMAYVIPFWASTLLLGGVLLLIGAALISKGKKDAKPGNMTPDRTIQSVRETPDAIRGRAAKRRTHHAQ